MEKRLALDDTDRAILRALVQDGRISNAALAQEVGLSEAPCWRRVKRLEEAGMIAGYRAVLSRPALGMDVFAFVSVRFSSHELEVARQFEEAMRADPSVLSCHNVTGESDYILEVAAQDLELYHAFTVRLRSCRGVVAIHTSLSLKEIKSGGTPPLP